MSANNDNDVDTIDTLTTLIFGIPAHPPTRDVITDFFLAALEQMEHSDEEIDEALRVVEGERALALCHVTMCSICHETHSDIVPTEPSENTEQREVREWSAIRQCGHLYHMTCIRQWLRNHAKCPLCNGAVF